MSRGSKITTNTSYEIYVKSISCNSILFHVILFHVNAHACVRKIMTSYLKEAEQSYKTSKNKVRELRSF